MHLSLDVMRAIVRRLSLWDARSLQNAHPAFARLVAEAVQGVVDKAMSAPPPPVLDAFLNVPPCSSERTHGCVTLFRTPRDATLHIATPDRVTVVARLTHAPSGADPRGRIELRMPPEPTRPTFDTLLHVLATMWWAHTAFRQKGCGPVEFKTRAPVHHPVSEVLNMLAAQFALTQCQGVLV